MENVSSIEKINFENMQDSIQRKDVIINTLNTNLQNCLIKYIIYIRRRKNLK